MSLSYTIREAFSGFKRTKLASLGSILTICIALLLLGIYYIVILNASRVVQMIRDKVEVEAFCEEPVNRVRVNELQEQMLAIDGVERVEFVSKEEAAKIFKQEFGEDHTDVLDNNPLPPSFKVFLKSEFKNSEKAGVIVANIKSLKGVDDVIYRKELLEFLDRRVTLAQSIGLALGILIGVSAIFLVSNTIRLAIYAKRKIIRTMKLVGATRRFIRMPFLLEGVVQGAFGGFLAAGVMYWLMGNVARRLSGELAEFIRVDVSFYGLLVGCGIILGLLGSMLSTRRYIGESVTT